MKIKMVLAVILANCCLFLSGCCSSGGCISDVGCGYNECRSYGSRCGADSCTYQCHVETFDYPCAGVYGCDGY